MKHFLGIFVIFVMVCFSSCEPTPSQPSQPQEELIADSTSSKITPPSGEVLPSVGTREEKKI
jgi:hypothetical protein